MVDPALNPATVALVDPVTGKFNDALMPEAVTDAVLASTASAQAAASSATSAAASADAALEAAQNAGGGPDAAASAAAAAAANAAAQAAASDADAARIAAEAAAAQGIDQGAVTNLINQQVSQAGRSGDYTQLANKPTIPTSAGSIGGILATEKNAANGVPGLDANKLLTYATATPGSRFDVKCPGGVQPNRPSARTDIFFDWLMVAEPSQAANKAIVGDGWRKEVW